MRAVSALSSAASTSSIAWTSRFERPESGTSPSRGMTCMRSIDSYFRLTEGLKGVPVLVRTVPATMPAPRARQASSTLADRRRWEVGGREVAGGSGAPDSSASSALARQASAAAIVVKVRVKR